MPGWLLPSWVQPTGEEGARPRDAVRRQRLEQLRELLAAASSEPALSLGTGDDPAVTSAGFSGSAATSSVDDANSGSTSSSPTSGATLDVAHSASNAVPFCTGGDRGQGAGSAAPGSTCRAEEAWQVLPWLYTAAGRLDFAAMESVASQLALSGLQLLDVTRYASAATAANGQWHAGLPANIRWAGAAPIPSPAVAAAAALRRMELRRGGALGELPEVEGKAVVLAYHPQHRQLAAETLALYLHAYLGLGGQEAVQVCFMHVPMLTGRQAVGLAGWAWGKGACRAITGLHFSPGCLACLAPTALPAHPPAGCWQRGGRVPSGVNAARVSGGAGPAGRWLVPPRHPGLALPGRPCGDCGGSRWVGWQAGRQLQWRIRVCRRSLPRQGWPQPAADFLPWHASLSLAAVCGWEERAPMFFDVKQKRWRLQIWVRRWRGLRRCDATCSSCRASHPTLTAATRWVGS